MLIKEFVAKGKAEFASELSACERKPHLLIIQANENPASDAYIRGKIKDAQEIGARATLRRFPITISEEDLIHEIELANSDADIDGIIVQLPLPKHISEAKIKLAVTPSKDVDGFHPLSSFDSCTPKGIIDYLEAEGFPFTGANAVVLGRSEIVGKPMAKLLLKHNCNVTVLHSKTTEQDKAFYIGHADLIVVAIGREAFLDNRFAYKPSAFIVDVGINRGEDGKLHGDAIPGLPVANQTPVPGGVGLLTRFALMANLMKAYRERQ